MLRVTEIPILVFSDLDGTLIDHHSYSADAASPALMALKACGGGLIITSSKTAPEVALIRDQLGWSDWPAIIENGSGVLPAGGASQIDTSGYAALRAVLANAPIVFRRMYRGFGDMSPAQVSQITGLDPNAAMLAKQRAFSEPGLWDGPDDKRRDFIAYLANQGVSAREGGRFLTLSFGQTKADRMAGFINQFKPRHTVALGDAPNDVEMLQFADIGVIVANPDSPPLPKLAGEEQGRIRRTTLAGPQGWNLAICAILSDLNLR